MPVTPQQTIVDTAQDPSLGYIQNRDIQTVIAAGGSQTTSTDKAIITNTFENITRSVTKVIETNVNADWNATTGTGVILNKPNLNAYATTTYVDSEIANVTVGSFNGNTISVANIATANISSEGNLRISGTDAVIIDGLNVSSTINPTSSSTFNLGSTDYKFDAVNAGSINSSDHVWLNAGVDYTFWYSIFGAGADVENANVAGASATADYYGDIYVLGNYEKNNLNQLMAVKYSPMGEVKWSQSWTAPTDNNVVGTTNHIIDDVNNVSYNYVFWSAFAQVTDSTSIGKTYLGKINKATGEQVDSTPKVLQNFKANDMFASYSPVTAVYLAGSTKVNGNTVPAVAKVDATTGEVIWAQSIPSLTSTEYTCATYATTSDNALYAIGTNNSGSNKVAVLHKYDSTGVLVAATNFSIADADVEGLVVEFNHVTQNIEVAIFKDDGFDTRVSIVGTFNSSLAAVWTRELGFQQVLPIRVSGLIAERPTEFTTGGNVYVAGSIFSGEFVANDKDFYVAKYDPRTMDNSSSETFTWEFTLGSNSFAGTNDGPAANSLNTKLTAIHQNEKLILTGETSVNPLNGSSNPSTSAFTWQIPTDGYIESVLYGEFLVAPMSGDWYVPTGLVNQAPGSLPSTTTITTVNPVDSGGLTNNTDLGTYISYRCQIGGDYGTISLSPNGDISSRKAITMQTGYARLYLPEWRVSDTQPTYLRNLAGSAILSGANGQAIASNSGFAIQTGNLTGTAKSWSFDADGILTLPVGGDIVDEHGTSVFPVPGEIAPGQTGEIIFNGTSIYNTANTSNINMYTSGNNFSKVSLKDNDGVYISGSTANGTVHEWRFGKEGRLHTNTTDIQTTGNMYLYTNGTDGGGSGAGEIDITNSGVTVWGNWQSTHQAGKSWIFNTDGNVYLPFGDASIVGRGNVLISGHDVGGNSGTTGTVTIRGGIDSTTEPNYQSRVNINDLYVQNSTIGSDGEYANLSLYSTFGMEFQTNGAGMRLEVGGAAYGQGHNMVILAGQGGEPSLNDSSDGGILVMSAGDAGFNDGSNAAGGNVYISGGNAADGQGGNVHIQGGYGDGGIAGSIILSSRQKVWTFDDAGTLTLPAGGDIVDSNGTSVLGAGGGGGAGLASRGAVSVTTASLANAASESSSFTAYKGYLLYKIQTSVASRVRLYTDVASRTTDELRTVGNEPAAGVGLITEIVTLAGETVVLAPAVYGFNNESSVTNQIPATITNLSGASAAVTVTLTVLQLEV